MRGMRDLMCSSREEKMISEDGRGVGVEEVSDDGRWKFSIENKSLLLDVLDMDGVGVVVFDGGG